MNAKVRPQPDLAFPNAELQAFGPHLPISQQPSTPYQAGLAPLAPGTDSR